MLVPDADRPAARLLVIEDDTAMARTVVRLLERAGHEVFTRRTLHEALHVLEANGAALVITGLLLPDKRGVEVVTALRSCHPTVPIIAVTGGLMRPHPDKLATAGAAWVLRRPFGPQALLHAVTASLPAPLSSEAHPHPRPVEGGSRG